jgi:hypothetical protein
MTRTSAAPGPNGEDGKIGQALVMRLLQQLQDTPVRPYDTDAVTASGHNGTDVGGPTRPTQQAKVVSELEAYTLDLIRKERRAVKQASAASLVGTILLWASLIIGIAVELGLLTWLGWEITHPLRHPDLFPPIVSTVANGACSGAAAYLIRFSRRKSSSSTPLEGIEAALDALDSLPRSGNPTA